MNTIETALRSYRFLLTHKHPEEIKQLACVNAALEALTPAPATPPPQWSGPTLLERAGSMASLSEHIWEQCFDAYCNGEPADGTSHERAARCLAIHLAENLAANPLPASEGTTRDTELLDWLDAQTVAGAVEVMNSQSCHKTPTVRDAIKQAMARQQEERKS